MYFHAFEILKHNVALEVGAVESISLVHLPLVVDTPSPSPWYDVVRAFPCSPVIILLATKMLLFPGESKVIQTSSKLVHLGKASSIFVGGPPLSFSESVVFKARRRERLESLALNSDYAEVQQPASFLRIFQRNNPLNP